MSNHLSKFRTANNRWITRGLFLEMERQDSDIQPVFTLRDEDYQEYKSLHKLYLSESDPSEYIFSEKHLGGWDHFKALQECSWFMDHLNRWREELDAKIRGYALNNIRDEANDTKSKNRFSANKFLLEGSWNKNSVGRPSNDKIRQEALKIHESDRLKEHELALLNDTYQEKLTLRIRN